MWHGFKCSKSCATATLNPSCCIQRREERTSQSLLMWHHGTGTILFLNRLELRQPTAQKLLRWCEAPNFPTVTWLMRWPPWEEHWARERAGLGLQLAPPCPETLLLTVVPDIKHTALPSAFSPGLCRLQLECRGPLLRQQWTPHLCSQTSFRHSSLPGGLRGGDKTVTSYAATWLPLLSTRHTQCLLEALPTVWQFKNKSIFSVFG